MASTDQLRDPWLVAAWPGLGGVAVIAATHLIRTLGAEPVHTLAGEKYFDLRQIDVRQGIASAPRLPTGYFYEWRNPADGRDLLIFIAEAQPDTGSGAMCREILEYARRRGVTRLVTFASLGTQLHPTDDADVHAVATDRDVLAEVGRAGAEPLAEGQIGGLNGVLLGVGKGESLPGACLMAEIPYFAGGVPNPKAAAAALAVFGALADLHIDLAELIAQGEAVDQQLLELFERLGGEEQFPGVGAPDEEDEILADAPEQREQRESKREPIDYATRERLEQMFADARRDRAKAIELKRELDRLGVFKQYEDRFLDLFKRAE
jgi:proteasome assembly chaperone (PAC2) family protein